MPQRDPPFATPEMSSDCQPARIDPYQVASASTTEGRLRRTISQAILTNFRRVSRVRKGLNVANMKPFAGENIFRIYVQSSSYENT